MLIYFHLFIYLFFSKNNSIVSQNKIFEDSQEILEYLDSLHEDSVTETTITKTTTTTTTTITIAANTVEDEDNIQYMSQPFPQEEFDIPLSQQSKLNQLPGWSSTTITSDIINNINNNNSNNNDIYDNRSKINNEEDEEEHMEIEYQDKFIRKHNEINVTSVGNEDVYGSQDILEIQFNKSNNNNNNRNTSNVDNDKKNNIESEDEEIMVTPQYNSPSLSSNDDEQLHIKEFTTKNKDKITQVEDKEEEEEEEDEDGDKIKEDKHEKEHESEEEQEEGGYISSPTLLLSNSCSSISSPLFQSSNLTKTISPLKSSRKLELESQDSNNNNNNNNNNTSQSPKKKKRQLDISIEESMTLVCNYYFKLQQQHPIKVNVSSWLNTTSTLKKKQ